MTCLRFPVGSIIGPKRVHLASELINAVSAAAAAKVQSKVGCRFEILEHTFGGSEMAAERAGIVSAKCRKFTEVGYGLRKRTVSSQKVGLREQTRYSTEEPPS
jgi:hypothetical protein